MSDKIGHFIAYLALSGSFILARFVTYPASLLGVAGVALFGVGLEWAQSFVPGRHPSVWDAAANALGAAWAAPLAYLWMGFWRLVGNSRFGFSQQLTQDRVSSA